MAIDPVDINFSLLRIYTYYRATLAGVLLLIFFSGIAPHAIGQQNPTLFVNTIILYAFINFLTLLALWFNKVRPKAERVFALLLIDITATIFIIHSSGGMGNGLSFLLLICIATGGILLNSQLSFVIAALASIALITETLYNINQGIGDSRTLFSAGSLGIMLFIAAYVFNYLSNRLRQSSKEAASQALQARHLAKMAQLIVERMQTGVVVCNSDGNIEIINKSAKNFLGWHDHTHTQKKITDIPQLSQQMLQWQNDPDYRPSTTELNNEVRLSFSKLDPQADSESVIFMEDNLALTQEAQQLKQASLGRLTASIAHEIRNPLGAISHAGQLLSESSHLDTADKRLIEIIDTHSKRVNQIIENIMQISRGKVSQPEVITLNSWLPMFIEDYKNSQSISPQNQPPNITLELLKTNIQARVDVSQLRQILNNLFDNGLRHGYQKQSTFNLLIQADTLDGTDLPQLRIMDYGEGISPDKHASIFEPFFTTEATGSGLGLYLSKALSEANHCSLEYGSHSGLSCFKLTFSHPNRIY